MTEDMIRTLLTVKTQFILYIKFTLKFCLNKKDNKKCNLTSKKYTDIKILSKSDVTDKFSWLENIFIANTCIKPEEDVDYNKKKRILDQNAGLLQSYTDWLSYTLTDITKLSRTFSYSDESEGEHIYYAYDLLSYRQTTHHWPT